ncbi:MAG: hypothetical protein K0U76_17435 [Actinomycetia bacterium]|nr:hypothetical protein [Actinomycetes bacterium]MCH9703133.1 hypothetical protein [Actinomycetes bacterium]
MTDEEILIKWRARYPDIQLSAARKLEGGERRWAHLQMNEADQGGKRSTRRSAREPACGASRSGATAS